MGQVGKPKGLRCMDPERIERRAAELRSRVLAAKERNRPKVARDREANRRHCRDYYRRKVMEGGLPITPEMAEYIYLHEIECAGGPTSINGGGVLAESHSLCLPSSSSRSTFRKVPCDRDLLQSLRGTGYHL